MGARLLPPIVAIVLALILAGQVRAQPYQVVPSCGAQSLSGNLGAGLGGFMDQTGNICGSSNAANVGHVITDAGSTTAIGATKHLASSLLTKIAGAGTYTSASATAPQAICLFASVTACAPLTMTVSATATVNGNITGIRLIKSTTGATAATFRVLVYQGVPTLAGVFNGSTYTPLIADLATAAYVGSWECTVQTVNSDNSSYECQANSPSGNNGFNLTDGTLRFVPLATGAYVSGSSETFQVVADILASAP